MVSSFSLLALLDGHEVAWGFDGYARWANAMGAILGSLVLAIGWWRSRTSELLLLANPQAPVPPPSDQRVAIECLFFSYALWSVPWCVSAYFQRPLSAVLSPAADQINSVLFFAAAVPLLGFYSKLPSMALAGATIIRGRGVFRELPIFVSKPTAERLVRRLPAAAAVLLCLAMVSAFQSMFELGQTWSMSFSIAADVALAIAVVSRPGNKAIQAGASVLLVLYACLQVPAHSISQLSEPYQRICFLALAALKPLMAFELYQAIEQYPVTIKGKVEWRPRRHKYDVWAVSALFVWILLVLTWAPIESLRGISLTTRIWLSAYFIVAAIWLVVNVVLRQAMGGRRPAQGQ